MNVHRVNFMVCELSLKMFFVIILHIKYKNKVKNIYYLTTWGYPLLAA